MGDTWDKVKNKGAEIKGEIKNEFDNAKKDFNDEDSAGDKAYVNGVAQAVSGMKGTIKRDATEAAKDTFVDRERPIPRKSDGSVDTEEAERRGEVKNQVKHLNKEEKKGYNDTLKAMRD